MPPTELETITSLTYDQFKPNPGSFRWDAAKKDHLGDVIGLTTADMDFPTSAGLKEAMGQFVQTGCLMYPIQHPQLAPVTLKRLHKRYHASNVIESDLVFFPSVVSAINALIWALNPADSPYTLLTPNYPPLFHFSQANSILEVPLSAVNDPNPVQRGRINFPLLEKALTTHNSKLILFSNPSNPIGKVWSANELDQLVTFAKKHHVSLISDEIWIDWSFHAPATTCAQFLPPATAQDHTEDDIDVGALKQSTATLAACCSKQVGEDALSPHTLAKAELTDPPITPGKTSPEIFTQPIQPALATVMATSKTFNLGGMNCAYIITRDRLLRKKLYHYLKFYCALPSQLSQHMLIYLYQNGEALFQKYKTLVSANRKLLKDFAAEHFSTIQPLLGEANHVVWIDATAFPAANPAAFFLEKANVHLFHGSAFGSRYKKFMRMNIATYPAVLAEALQRMKNAIKNH